MKELTLREQQLIVLDILKYFDEVCRKYNIKYTICGGTLIGAIRHKGFIPWDDDIDVYMVREEYEKFKKVLEENKSENYYLSDIDNFNSFTAGVAPKIYDKRTLLTDYMGRKQPIFIDIFVLDYVENNKDNRLELEKYKKNLLLFAGIHLKFMKSESFVYKMIYKYKSRIYFNKMMKTIRCFSEKTRDNSEFLASVYYIFDGIDKAFIPAYYFNNYVELEFENCKFYAIANYDEHLSFYYGNYMELPSPKDRSPKHTKKAYML